MFQKHTNCDNCDFRREICEVITEGEFEEIYRQSEPLIFEKGETIIKQGTATLHMAYLVKGMVKFEHLAANKQMHIPGIIKAPSLFGGCYTLSGTENMMSIVALEKSSVCLIATNVIRSRASVNPLFGLRIFDMMSSFHQQLLENQLSLSSKRVPGRIAGVLLMFQNKIFGSPIFTLPLTRREISNLAACSEENVIRTLSSFEADKMIVTNGKETEIIDEIRLKQVYDRG